MTLTPIECEARLMGMSKVDRKDGEWTQLTLQIHPHETPYALFLLPLKTHVMLSIKGTEEEDVTAPEAETEAPKLKGGPISIRAGKLCNKAAFQDFLRAKWPGHWGIYDNGYGVPVEDIAACVIRRLCTVESRAELDHKPIAAKVFEDIERNYHDAMEGRTDEALMEQRR